MIAFPLADNQYEILILTAHITDYVRRATANLKMNLTQVRLLGDAWNQTELKKFAGDLSKTPNTANAGGLKGNRM
jgi:hypothetical protein